jgi:lipopolysaccharide/colanic/teichoic acid biosynthesis glycosyltransferase
MIHNAEAECGPIWAEDNDCRVTRAGRVLRKFRFDEIPQMWNVLRGDMSFVGPRPERPEFVEELEEIVPYYSERHTVKPGITGWAQVSYSYGASVEAALEKLKYDLFYIKNMSILMDFIIILKTFKIVMQQSGAR